MSSEPNNHTIGTTPAVFFVCIAAILDLLKILFLFADAIPFVGPAIGFLGSWIDSALEFIFLTVGLYLCGAFKGRNAVSSGLITMGMGMINLVPLLNDLPSTTAGVLVIIMRSRMNDKLEEKTRTSKFSARKLEAVNDNQAQERSRAVAKRMLDSRSQQTNSFVPTKYREAA